MKDNERKKKKSKDRNNFWDISDLNDFFYNNFKDIMDMFDFSSDKMVDLDKLGENEGSDEKTRSYSISYKYKTGMDKPEININGNPVNSENFKDLFRNITNLGIKDPTLNQIELDPRDFQLSSGNSKSLNEFEEPLYDLIEDSNGHPTGITLELPGVSIEKIIISYFDDEVIITGESEDRIFRKELTLEYKPDKEKTQVFGKNGIYQIHFSK
jgi:HSP20 family molecular chaperone IbpA